MDLDNINLVKTGKLTSFYFKLLKNINTKIDSKIKDISSKIISEFESKKREILKLKTQLDDFNKIKQTIDPRIKQAEANAKAAEAKAASGSAEGGRRKHRRSIKKRRAAKKQGTKRR